MMFYNKINALFVERGLFQDRQLGLNGIRKEFCDVAIAH